MKRSTDRILTTHVGSLLRPDDPHAKPGGTLASSARLDPR